MEGAQLPVEPPLVGSFFFFFFVFEKFSLNFFLSFKQPKSSLLFFEFSGCLKRRKNPEKNYSQNFSKKKKKKGKTARWRGFNRGLNPLHKSLKLN